MKVDKKLSRPLDTSRIWKQLLVRRLKLAGAVLLAIAVLGGGTYMFAPQWLMRLDAWRIALVAGLSTRHLQVGDTNWAYYEGGKGPTMVLLHGYGSNRRVWLKIARPLARNFHLVIPDLPGWGDSTRINGAAYGVPAQAKRLGAFLHALKLTRPILVGHSMGGAIAGYYASEHPDRVGSLVLVDSFGLTFKENQFAREALAGTNPFIFDNREGFRRMARLVFDKPPDLPGRFIDVLVARNKANRAFLDKVFDRLRQKGEYNALDDRLGRLTMPVMGIWCHDDKIIDPSALTTLRTGLVHAPSISVALINGCDHVPQIEKPTVLEHILARFAVSHEFGAGAT